MTRSKNRRRPVSKTARALALAFGTVLLLFTVATLASLEAVGRARAVEAEVAEQEQLRRQVDGASVLMREQYIHQAHTLIAWDDSHLGHYGEVAARAAEAVQGLRPAVSRDDLPLVERMAVVVEDSHRAFLDETMPTVRAGDRARARELHEEMEQKVTLFAGLARELHDHIEARVASAQARSNGAWQAARRIALVCLGSAALSALVLGALLTRTIARRLDRLRDGAARLASGDLSARIPAQGDDEFAEVARAFNDMSAALDARQRELVRAQRLAAIGHVAAGVAHELNNPLGVILGYVALLKRQPSGDAEALRVIEDEAVLARDIVQSLLDLARPNPLRMAEVDLAALAREGAQRLQQVPELASVVVTQALPSAPVLVRGDEARLRQVVMNLMRNAAEAGPPDIGIEIQVRTGATRAELAVRDHGPGFPIEGPERALDPFFTTKPHGVGLGLAIVQAVVEAHGGTLELGRADGGGAEVRVGLPLAPGASA